jgi:hypothetical protein
MSKPTFICSACGDELPASMLSQTSLDKSETKSKVAALLILPAVDLLCTDCGSVLEDGTVYEGPGTNEVERWNMSGLEIDPAVMQAYRNNY